MQIEGTTNRRYKAQVVETNEAAMGVKVLSIKLDFEFEFKSGQYIWVEIPKLTVDDRRGSRRAFSIINNQNNENIVKIVARISESGYKQNLFALKPGDEVIVHGPFGNSFVIDNKSPKNIVMIAGGVGIAAFLANLEEITLKKLNIRCYLIYLNRDEQGTPFLDTLKELKKGSHTFDYVVKYGELSAEDISGINEWSANAQWWISGSQPMVNFVYNILSTAGIARLDMVFENYYPKPPESLTPEGIKKYLVPENIFAQAIQFTTNHTVITDTEGNILYANKAAEETTGYTIDEMVGNTPRLWGGLMSPEFYKNLWQRKKAGETFEGEIINRRKNGDLYYSMAHISPISNKDNIIIGYIATEEDITHLKRQSEIIEQDEQRLKFALEGSRDGLWDWDLVNNTIYYSPEWKKMLGYKDNEIKDTYEEWQKRVWPEDLPGVEQKLKDHMDGKTQFYDTTYRMVNKDNNIIWILDKGMVTNRKDGKPMRFVGTHTDITTQKEREIQLEQLNTVMIDRELKMVALKKENKLLRQQLAAPHSKKIEGKPNE